MIGLETDALVTQGVVERKRETGRFVLDAPGRRSFWYGHGFVLDRPPDNARFAALIAEGTARFEVAGAERFVIEWERPLTADAIELDLPPQAQLERSLAMVYRGMIADPDAAAVPLSDAGWVQAKALVRAQYADAADFTARRLDDLRTLVMRGRAHAVGVRDESGAVAACAGIVRDAKHARFVLPVTRPDARRRGYFSACARTLIAWAASDGQRDIVIVVDPVDGPERLYRSLGFVPASRIDAVVVRLAPAPGAELSPTTL